MKKLLIVFTSVFSVLPFIFNMVPYVNFSINIGISFLWLILLTTTIYQNRTIKKVYLLLLLLPVGFTPVTLGFLFFLNMLLHGFKP